MSPSIVELREHFNNTIAEPLAEEAGVSGKEPFLPEQPTRRFAYFGDADHLAIVAGDQEGKHVDLALAQGLALRGQRRLVLVLPKGLEFATLQRAAWLEKDAQPAMWVHDRRSAERLDIGDRESTHGKLLEHLETTKTPDPASEFAAATTPGFIGDRGAGVIDFVEWATAQPELEPAHRPKERSWHCMGLRVLSIRLAREGVLRIRAGVHWSDIDRSPAEEVGRGEDLDEATSALLKARVAEAIVARLEGHPGLRHAADEHWLQAVLRRRPDIVGVEQPALREVPAWRPGTKWGRGFIDLVGLDGHGDIRIVETKLAKNPDDLFVFQGLDYYVWSRAYETELRRRLGAPAKSRCVVHYVVGATPGQSASRSVYGSRYLPAQLRALHSSFPWQFQVVEHWFGYETPFSREPESKRFPERVLPEDEHRSSG